MSNTQTTPTKLNDDQIAVVRGEIVPADSPGRPVRFLLDGQALNIITGELCAKSTNVMYHPVYWYFTKETAEKIAEWLNVKAVFSD
jgi:hypothetical protein